MYTIKYDDDIKYEFNNGWTLTREYGKSPNGNNYNGQWVLRDSDNKYVYHDRYRNDIAEMFNINLDVK